MHRFIYQFLFFLVLAGSWVSGFAQPSQKHDPAVTIRYGTDDLLSQGSPYRPVFRRAKGHQYFVSSDHDKKAQAWVKGSHFSQLMISYDLELDQVVTKLILQDSSSANLVFEPEWLDSFKLHDKLFINANILIPDEPTRNYLAHVHSNKDTFLLEYRKTFIDSYNKANPYGRYSELGQRFILIRNDDFHNISSKKRLYALFPEKKDRIKEYLKSNKVKYRRASIVQAKKIAAICETD